MRDRLLSFRRGISIIFRDRDARKKIILATVVILIVNITTPVILQGMLAGRMPTTIRLFESMDVGGKKVFYIILVGGEYEYGPEIPTIQGDTYLYFTLTPLDLLIFIIISIIAGITIGSTLYLSRFSKGKCRFEKGGASIGSAASILGASTISTSILSCPSCGFSAASSIATFIVASLTGSTLGVSRLYINLFYFICGLGLIINIVILIYVGLKLGSLA